MDYRRTAPLQTVLFISDICNLRCKHCSVYELKNPHNMTYEQVRGHLQKSYDAGSRFVDFEGGEVTLWKDGDKRINDLIDLAKEIGFFSCTITTNAQLPFKGSRADSIWVSLDGVNGFHEEVRGKGTFAKLEKNIAECGHRHLSVNMVVNALNYTAVDDTIEYAKNNLAIECISINFHTPFEGTYRVQEKGLSYHEFRVRSETHEDQQVQTSLLGDGLRVPRRTQRLVRRSRHRHLRQVRILYVRRDGISLLFQAGHNLRRSETQGLIFQKETPKLMSKDAVRKDIVDIPSPSVMIFHEARIPASAASPLNERSSTLAQFPSISFQSR